MKVRTGIGESKGQRLGVKSGEWWHESWWNLVLEINLAQSRGEKVAAG